MMNTYSVLVIWSMTPTTLQIQIGILSLITIPCKLLQRDVVCSHKQPASKRCSWPITFRFQDWALSHRKDQVGDGQHIEGQMRRWHDNRQCAHLRLLLCLNSTPNP